MYKKKDIMQSSSTCFLFNLRSSLADNRNSWGNVIFLSKYRSIARITKPTRHEKVVPIYTGMMR